MNFSLLPAFINHLLQPETAARNKLAAHAGKVACVDAGVASVRLKIAGDGLVQALESGERDRPADVTVQIRPADLPLILQDRARAASYVRIAGDADFASAVAQVVQSLRWDPEEDASRVVGDIAGVRVVASARAALAVARDMQRQLAENTAEYFLDEQPMLVRPHATAAFGEEVGRLRDDLERLAKRVEKLASKNPAAQAAAATTESISVTRGGQAGSAGGAA